MSFEEEFEKATAETAKENTDKWRKNPKWLAIEGITREDLLKGAGRIEKLDRPPWEKKANAQENKSNEELVGFGKHAQLTIKELKEKHTGYYNWACSEIKGFKNRVLKYENSK